MVVGRRHVVGVALSVCYSHSDIIHSSVCLWAIWMVLVSDVFYDASRWMHHSSYPTSGHSSLLVVTYNG